jgi:hypothetical protein
VPAGPDRSLSARRQRCAEGGGDQRGGAVVGDEQRRDAAPVAAAIAALDVLTASGMKPSKRNVHS